MTSDGKTVLHNSRGMARVCHVGSGGWVMRHPLATNSNPNSVKVMAAQAHKYSRRRIEEQPESTQVSGFKHNQNLASRSDFRRTRNDPNP